MKSGGTEDLGFDGYLQVIGSLWHLLISNRSCLKEGEAGKECFYIKHKGVCVCVKMKKKSRFDCTY